MHCRVQRDWEEEKTGAETGTVGDTMQPIALSALL